MAHKSLRFESFVFDLERLSLRGPSGQADLRRKSFEVLRYLLEHAGRVATKEEVMKAVWPDVTVSDESLTQCIHDIRRAIGDESQRIIKTVPRRGYLIDVPVLLDDVSGVPPAHATVLTLPDRPSVAVLAFTNLGRDPEEDYLADGIVEDIITELSRFSELFVIARNSSFHYKGKAVDVRQVGRELGVRYVLEGSIRRGSERVRISAQLIDAVTGAHRWAERYDRNLEDVFTLQVELARSIVAILAAHVNRAEAERALAKRLILAGEQGEGVPGLVDDAGRHARDHVRGHGAHREIGLERGEHPCARFFVKRGMLGGEPCEHRVGESVTVDECHARESAVAAEIRQYARAKITMDALEGAHGLHLRGHYTSKSNGSLNALSARRRAARVRRS